MDPSMEKIFENFYKFVEMVSHRFKAIVKATANEANLKAPPEKAYGIVHVKLEERKKLLTEVIVDIDGVSDDEAMLIVQVLGKYHKQLKIFLGLLDYKRLCFCHVLLTLLFTPHTI